MRRAFARFWDEDRGLSLLLLLLVGVILAGGVLTRPGLVGETILGLLFTMMLTSGVVAVSRRHWVGYATAALAAAAVSMEWISQAWPTPLNRVTAALGGFACVTLLAALVFHKVLREGSITMHRIIGSVAAYMLLGFAWGELYRFFSILEPGALGAASGSPVSRAQHLYFSFVTLTTVGYGDIVPLHPATRALAVLEALTGQLVPAILIARLVSLELMARGGRR